MLEHERSLERCRGIVAGGHVPAGMCRRACAGGHVPAGMCRKADRHLLCAVTGIAAKARPRRKHPGAVPWPSDKGWTSAHWRTVQSGVGSGVSRPALAGHRRAVLRRVEAPIRIADRGFDFAQFARRRPDQYMSIRTVLRPNVSAWAISRRNRRPMARCRGKRRRSRRPRSAAHGWQGPGARRRRCRHRWPRCQGRIAGHRSSRYPC